MSVLSLDGRIKINEQTLSIFIFHFSLFYLTTCKFFFAEYKIKNFHRFVVFLKFVFICSFWKALKSRERESKMKSSCLLQKVAEIIEQVLYSFFFLGDDIEPDPPNTLVFILDSCYNGRTSENLVITRRDHSSQTAPTFLNFLFFGFQNLQESATI